MFPLPRGFPPIPRVMSRAPPGAVRSLGPPLSASRHSPVAASFLAAIDTSTLRLFPTYDVRS